MILSPPPCPHCFAQERTMSKLEMHIHYLCPVLRGADRNADTRELART